MADECAHTFSVEAVVHALAGAFVVVNGGLALHHLEHW
jgi:hypothetical protein